jgi:predicted MPP superfamily phosphohydrolase
VLAIALAALTLWAVYLEPVSLRVREYRLDLPRWSKRDAGIRVALIADLHVGSPFNGLDKASRLVAETNAADPDLILLAGDFVIRDIIGGERIPPEPTVSYGNPRRRGAS